MGHGPHACRSGAGAGILAEAPRLLIFTVVALAMGLLLAVSFLGLLGGTRALATLDAIGRPENIDAWVRPRVEAGERMMGFGHAVYRTEDPRLRLLESIAIALGEELERDGQPGKTGKTGKTGNETVAFAIEVEQRIVEILAELKPGREIYANVEFYAGVVMELCGLPREMFTPTFASSRMIGWCTHILEQAAEGKLIRPSARYVGPRPGAAVPEMTER